MAQPQLTRSLTSSGCFQAVALKKTIRELEEKVQDQEEELDDQAGKIQMLEQVSVAYPLSQLLKLTQMLEQV